MPELNSEIVRELFREQLDSWTQARGNYEALGKVITRQLVVDGFPFMIQFNPARIVSSAAKVDAKSIQERKCFLCEKNRPSVQKGLDFFFKGTDHYTVLINPFPIFSRHLTIPLMDHQDQLISGKFDAMLALAGKLTDYTIFYNGPKCGASAPDHFHFQAGIKGFMPIEREKLKKREIFRNSDTILSELLSGINGALVMESSSAESACELFNKTYSCLSINEGEKEPMLNILCWYENGIWTTVIFLRARHRPSCYFAEGDDNILISPASVDLGGVFITPLEKDFKKITEKDIKCILSEVLISFDELHEVSEKIKKYS